MLTDWSYALAGFLVSTLFGVSPANPSNFSLFPDSLSFFSTAELFCTLKCASACGTSRSSIEVRDEKAGLESLLL